jgi:hypothetical protein
MADDDAQQHAVEADETSLQASSVTATSTVDRPIGAASFPKFAAYPEEIRRMIWQRACLPARMHYLELPKRCTLPAVGLLSDPACASHHMSNHPGICDGLAPVLGEMQRFIRSSEDWKVKIYLMASVRKRRSG